MPTLRRTEGPRCRAGCVPPVPAPASASESAGGGRVRAGGGSGGRQSWRAAARAREEPRPRAAAACASCDRGLPVCPTLFPSGLCVVGPKSKTCS